MLTPYLVEDSNGSILPADWGKVFVPENRTKPDSNTIEVPFVRFKSTAENPSAPIFFLDGGPGDIPSTLDCLEELIPLTVEPYVNTSDVVILEQ